MSEETKLLEIIKGLSDDAVYMMTLDFFGSVLMNKPILAAPQNKRQEAIFEELLEAGFVHGDVERGVFGYRSTYDGRDARNLLVKAGRATPA